MVFEKEMPRQLGNPSVHKKKMNLQVSILTPEKPFWDGEAEEIILPAETGIYPAVDPLESTSTMLQPWIVGEMFTISSRRLF